MKPIFNFFKDAEAASISIRNEWIWYRRVLRVVYDKPKLRRQIKEQLEILEAKYYGVLQIPEPPRTGSPVQKPKERTIICHNE